MQKECQYCHKLVEIKNPDPSRGSLHNHIARCKSYKTYIDDLLSKDLLEREYVLLRKSAYEMSIDLGIGVSPILRKLIDYGIPTRSISESKKEPRCKERAAKTNLERHGAEHNFSRNHPSRIIWQKRLFDNEGINNVFQRQSVIDKIAESIASNPESRKARYGSRISGPHKKVYNYIRELGIDNVVMEYGMSIGTKKKYFDLYIPSYNLIIEVNGNLWHANPEIYKPNDLIRYFQQNITVPAHEVWKNDYEKIKIALQANYNVLIVWEKDINQRWNDIKSKIDTIVKGNDNASATTQICEESIQYLQQV